MWENSGSVQYTINFPVTGYFSSWIFSSLYCSVSLIFTLTTILWKSIWNRIETFQFVNFWIKKKVVPSWFQNYLFWIQSDRWRVHRETIRLVDDKIEGLCFPEDIFERNGSRRDSSYYVRAHWLWQGARTDQRKSES